MTSGGSGSGLPWWSVVIVGALAFASGRWLGRPEPSTPAATSKARAPSTSPGRSDGAPTSSPVVADEPRGVTDDQAQTEAPLRLLERCTATLAQANRRAAAASEPALSVRACLDDPAVRAACQPLPPSTPQEPSAGSDGGDNTSNEGSAARDESFARAFATSVVGVDDGEARWLETYLCTVHQLREQMIGDLETLMANNAAPDRVEAVIEEARSQRKDVLADLEQQLGAERYQRLRAVGGLGIMGSSLQCSPEP